MPLRRAAPVALAAILSLSTAASGVRKPTSPGVAYVESPDLLKLRRHGNDLLRASDFDGAVRIYESGADAAQQQGDARSAIRFLNNLGSANYLMFRHRDALKAWLRARDLATPSDGESWM